MGHLVDLPPPDRVATLRRLVATSAFDTVPASGDTGLTLDAFDEAIEALRTAPNVPIEAPPLPPHVAATLRWYDERRCAPWYRPRAADKRREAGVGFLRGVLRASTPGRARPRRARVVAW